MSHNLSRRSFGGFCPLRHGGYLNGTLSGADMGVLYRTSQTSRTGELYLVFGLCSQPVPILHGPLPRSFFFVAPLSDVSECLFFSCNNLIFRMRAEWIPQGYGIRSARIRNMGAMWCGIPESVHTPHPLFLK